MKMSRTLQKYHVRASVVNMKTGKAASRIYIVQTNGFMGLKEAVQKQVNANEKVEHVEVL